MSELYEMESRHGNGSAIAHLLLLQPKDRLQGSIFESIYETV